MAISTQGTILNITGTKGETPINIDVAIKSFPDLGAAPAAIEVTCLSDDSQKFIPGIKGMAAMEFVANYDASVFEQLVGAEGLDLTYKVNFGETEYSFSGKHNALIVGAGLNAAVDMKVVVLPGSKITKVA
ncbi:hypothetical protein [Anaerofustis stercorihominis]|uniref:Phage tail protein n=1 Tax=Anaerofustis stercorihominis TaxID=214853 RepID=A0A3E3DXF8_9FIRM|nr:hypothetical protein [Anaerofustis stercorihominis]RGD73766.1 hypothetical protein DW687_08265 [Anaerofustis stercorihominis]